MSRHVPHRAARRHPRRSARHRRRRRGARRPRPPTFRSSCRTSVSSRDLEMLAVGALSPLTGFQGEADYHSVLDSMHLATGSRGRSRSCSASTRSRHTRSAAAVRWRSRPPRTPTPIAVLRVSGSFTRDKQKEAVSVYRTDEAEHPGVKAVYDSGDYCLAGDLRGTVAAGARRLRSGTGSRRPRRAPSSPSAAGRRSSGSRPATRSIARTSTSRSARSRSSTGCSCIRSMGATKSDDVPPDVRMQCYEALFEGYYPKDRAMVSIFPAAMRYAGPREAIWHAICRKNYGCTHFIVGRDHAGVGTYYGTYDAQQIFNEFEPGELGITTLNFEHSFWCESCEGMASPKTCPHGEETRISLSRHEGARDAEPRRASAPGVLAARGRRHPHRRDARSDRLNTTTQACS